MKSFFAPLLSVIILPASSSGFVLPSSSSCRGAAGICRNAHISDNDQYDRRSFMFTSTAAMIPFLILNQEAAVADDSMDVDNFLKMGSVSQPMGVSGQAGKGKPVTGVVLRDGSEVLRESRSGEVVAEILVKSRSDGGDASTTVPVLAGFSSPWSLATGTIFDVECRDAKTGDGAFLAVTEETNSKKIEDIPSSFFLDRLFSNTGRFSFYGTPTDIKVKKSYMNDEGSNRILELSFSTLSQSTQTEIPRNAILSATIPQGTNQVVMLVASASANRWRKSGSESIIRDVITSYRAIPAPKTNMKVRAKEQGRSS